MLPRHAQSDASAAPFHVRVDMFYYMGGILSYIGTIAGVWYLSRSNATPANVVSLSARRQTHTLRPCPEQCTQEGPRCAPSPLYTRHKVIFPVVLFWVSFSQATRTWVLLGTGFCQGLSLGSLITPVFYFAPDLLFTAFLGTSAIFACFSGAAILSSRRSFLYLSATISSVVGVMFTMVGACSFRPACCISPGREAASHHFTAFADSPPPQLPHSPRAALCLHVLRLDPRCGCGRRAVHRSGCLHRVSHQGRAKS